MLAERVPIRIVVVGGGTAGWMTAAALTALAGAACQVRLIESEDVGIVGVGEATLPHLRAFIERLGIDEREFMAATDATFKLGIEFRDFGRLGDAYIHPFGTFGRELNGVGFHHFWLSARQAGLPNEIGDYSLAVVAARERKFEPWPDAAVDDSVDGFGYAYHFDSTKFAPFLRSWACAKGAQRLEGRIVDVVRDSRVGDVEEVVLSDGRRICGDLFVDCSGFASLLLGGALAQGWEDWSHWLPCDRAIAAPTSADLAPPPYTRATGMASGWRWEIPLQHRTGNGYVFASAYVGEDQAREELLRLLPGPLLAEPRMLAFSAGRRRRSWVGNVVAIGLSSGFLEPLESTSIYLVQMAITELIEHFPARSVLEVERGGFNAAVDFEYERIRDFLILHYHATERTDTPFWNHVRTMDIPSSLERKIELWRQTAQIARYERGLFLEPSWVAVYLGQRLMPLSWDQRAELPTADALRRAMDGLGRGVALRATSMRSHVESLSSVHS